MWVRKSEERFKSTACLRKRAGEPAPPLAPASALTILTTALYAFGLRGYYRGAVIVSNAPAGLNARSVFAAGFLFSLFFAVAVYYQRRFGSLGPPAADSLLCRECKQPAHANPSGLCQCGGRLEPFSFFSWVEGQEAEA